jgi:hypothetical protein
MLSHPRPSCSEVRRELEALALGEVPPSDRALLLRHVASCETCARAAREAAAILRRLSALAPARPVRGWMRAAAVAVAVVLVVVAGRLGVDAEGGAKALPAAAATAPDVPLAALLAAQSPDGAWRDAATSRSPAMTAGLSGLAALGCLAAASDDPAANDAARHACDFLVKSLGSDDAGLAPEVRLQSRAVTAWALGIAARQWPARYRAGAAKAVRALQSLEDSLPASTGSSEVTRALVACAFGAAGSGRYADDAAQTTVARLVRKGHVTPAGADAPVSILAARVLGSTLPTPDIPPF